MAGDEPAENEHSSTLQSEMVGLLASFDELSHAARQVGGGEVRQNETVEVELEVRVGDDGCASSVGRGDSIAVLL